MSNPSAPTCQVRRRSAVESDTPRAPFSGRERDPGPRTVSRSGEGYRFRRSGRRRPCGWASSLEGAEVTAWTDGFRGQPPFDVASSRRPRRPGGCAGLGRSAPSPAAGRRRSGRRRQRSRAWAFGHDGTPPFDLRRTGQEQLRPYESVTTRMATVEEVRLTPYGFSVVAGGTPSEAAVLCRHRDAVRIAAIEGVADSGPGARTIAPTAIGRCAIDARRLRSGRSASRAHLGIAQRDIVLLTDGNSDLDHDEAEHLRERGIAIREDSVARREPRAESWAGLLADGSTDDRTGLFFIPTSTASPLPAQLMRLVDSARSSSTGMAARALPRLDAGGATPDEESVVLTLQPAPVPPTR